MMLVQDEFGYTWPALKYVEMARNQNNIRLKQGVLDAF